MANSKVTVPGIVAKKQARQPIVMVTAYDATMGRLVDAAGVDMVLVGDSLAMVVLGHDTTLPVTMEEMLHHTRAVRRGVERALVVADMPFGSYQGSWADTWRNATRFLKDAGADAVKLEGGRWIADEVRKLTEAGVPVVGHVGLLPQSVREYGGFKVQGRDPGQRAAILEDAKAIADAGAFAIVLECIPESLAAEITAAVPVPTIGIGAGRSCDGQVLVLHDILGLVEGFKPKFVKRYAHLAQDVKDAVARYCEEVRTGAYPGEEHRYQ